MVVEINKVIPFKLPSSFVRKAKDTIPEIRQIETGEYVILNNCATYTLFLDTHISTCTSAGRRSFDKYCKTTMQS